MLLLSYLVIYCCSSIWPSCCQGLRCKLLVATLLFCQFGLRQALANHYLPGLAALLFSGVRCFENLQTPSSYCFSGFGGWSSFLSRTTLLCTIGLVACHPKWNKNQLFAVYDCLLKSLAVLCASSTTQHFGLASSQANFFLPLATAVQLFARWHILL